MKEQFSVYYTPDFEKLWSEATFVFDTNVLLNLYRYSSKTSEELFNILEDLKEEGKIWIPYQFAYEYHKNLLGIHNSIANEYKEKEDKLRKKMWN